MAEGLVLGAMAPHSCVSIIVQEVHNDGALFSCGVNAMCLALLDAGVPMAGVVASVMCVANPATPAEKGSALLLDPLLAEERAAVATLEFSLAPGTPHGVDAEHDSVVLAASSTGSFSSADVRICVGVIVLAVYKHAM